LHQPSLILNQVIRDRVHLVKCVLSESVQVVLRNLVIDVLELCILVSPSVSWLRLLGLCLWGSAGLDGMLFGEVLLGGLRVVHGGRKDRGAARVRESP